MAKKKKVEELKQAESENIKHDTVHLLRGVMKISSALVDLDEIIDNGKYYRFGFKKEVEKWAKFMELHTAQLMSSLVEEDSTLLMDIYNALDGSTNKVQISPEKTPLVIFYCKIKSSMNDINEMKENRNTFYPRFIEIYTNNVIKQMEKQFHAILNTKDYEDRGLDFIINFFDDFGKNIMKFEDK
jgi:hypothetical protein